MQAYPVVSRDEWLIQRRALLAREKEAIHLHDAINAERQVLSWVKVDVAYVFESPGGRKALLDLFDGRSQLMAYHFMLGLDWDAGCPGCFFLSDHIGGVLSRLNHHDVMFVTVSRALIDKIATYKKRMGWRSAWVPSFGSTFNRDYRMSFSQNELANGSVGYSYAATSREEAHDELPGMSAFYKDEARNVFHTYSTHARGLEDMIGTLLLLDYVPLGRNENGPMSWVRRHDEYEDVPNTYGCSTT